MGCPDAIKRLVERFDHQSDQVKSPEYNETLLRIDFVNPMFAELGWDIDNSRGYAEQYREVVHEDRLRIAGANKAPDYSFRVGGVRKFFLEAKKPFVNIREGVEPAYQLRRYAWSAKLAASLLTDFEELAIYDTRIRPKHLDKASTARREYITYRQYEEKWDFLAATFSREAVLRGDFDRYCGSARGRGAQEFDEAFLDEIEEWRKKLAKNLAEGNESLDERPLNFAVQRIIDRIIFLRICEDRGIEHVGQLRALINGDQVYARLFKLFRDADTRYNSGLFHFKKEAGREEQPDELTPVLEVDDAPLKHILKRLYYPESPYEFTVVSADILGSIYERFLGKVITLTAGHQVRIEEKPEVRKAGGVYYTPTYIVDYIVQHTVGKLLEGKTPKEAADLKILDPACGSGSFLIGAYEYLLDWHLNWYAEHDPEKWAKGKNATIRPASPAEPPVSLFPPAPVRKAAESWRLTIQERKRILLNNIHGVDIDYQAVEVTKLSLLLKVLEGETAESLGGYWTLFRERALPDLGHNVQCGNSLIGSDIMTTDAWQKMSEDERRRVNAFDFERAFPQCFKQGGFDAVIGNPPYIPMEMLTAVEKKYLESKHPELERKYDSAAAFILRGLRLLNRQGRLAYISSLTWQTGENYSSLRRLLFSEFGLESVVNLPFDTFADAYVDTGVYVLTRSQQHSYRIFRYPKRAAVSSLAAVPFADVPTAMVIGPEWKLILDLMPAMFVRRWGDPTKFKSLGDVTQSTQGLAGNRFEPKVAPRDSSWFPYLLRGQVHRFFERRDEIAYVSMADKPSLTRFYEAVPKLLIRRVISRQDRLLATCSHERIVYKKDINPFIITDPRYDPRMVLGILNSRLTSYVYVNTSAIATKDDFRQTTLAELRRLPIPNIDAVDRARCDRLTGLVESMLSLHGREHSATLPQEKEQLRRQIETTDRQIDQLVYELYGLTDEEIRIVEAAVEPRGTDGTGAATPAEAEQTDT